MKKMTKVSIFALAVVMLLSASFSVAAFTPPTNLLPADALTSADKADDYFTNVSTDAADYSYEDAEYIMRVPESAKGTNWIATKDEIPYTSYTVSADIRPVDYTSGSTTKTGGAAILLGTNTNAAFPWHSIRFNFSSVDGTVSFMGFEHKGSAYGYMDPSYTVLKSGIDFEEKEWFNVKVEITTEGSTVYLDGETFLEDRNARLPDSTEIQWVGLYPEGSTAGFDVKNFQITDKATSAKLLPEDLFTAAKASAHLTKVDAASYTVEGTVPMMRVPIVSNSNNWVFTKNPLPTESFTITADVKPLKKTGSNDFGGTGILLGKGADNRFPWFNLQFNYADGKVTVYVVEHLGSGYGYLKNFTEAPILTGVDFAEKEWFNIKIEVTAEGTEVYVDGQPIPAEGAAKLPKLGEIKYVGLYPSGGSNGYWVKNVGLYNGVDLVFEEPVTPPPSEEPSETPSEEPSETPSATPEGGQEENKPTGDVSILACGLILVLGVACVVIRKRSCAE